MCLQDWLCKTLTGALLYSWMANISWMLVEGLYLHNKIAICVFQTEAPFLAFNVLGWGKHVNARFQASN